MNEVLLININSPLVEAITEQYIIRNNNEIWLVYKTGDLRPCVICKTEIRANELCKEMNLNLRKKQDHLI